MAAPTKPASVKKSLANPEPSTHGPSPKRCSAKTALLLGSKVMANPAATKRRPNTARSRRVTRSTLIPDGRTMKFWKVCAVVHQNERSGRSGGPFPGVPRWRCPPVHRSMKQRAQLTRSSCHASIQGVMKSPKQARTQQSAPEFGAGRFSMSKMAPIVPRGTCCGRYRSRKRTLVPTRRSIPRGCRGRGKSNGKWLVAAFAL
jgi:hypothetical protein